MPISAQHLQKMPKSSIFSIILALCGTLLIGVALLSGIASIGSLLERREHGPGLLFADVEILGGLSLVCLVSGAAALLGSFLLRRRRSRDDP
jgi:cyanate permease